MIRLTSEQLNNNLKIKLKQLYLTFFPKLILTCSQVRNHCYNAPPSGSCFQQKDFLSQSFQRCADSHTWTSLLVFLFLRWFVELFKAPLEAQNVLPMQETQCPSLGWEDPLEKGRATRSWWATVCGVTKNQTHLSNQFHVYASQVAAAAAAASC